MHEVLIEQWTVPRYTARRSAFRPQVDVFRSEDPPCLTVVVELAGVEPAAVAIVIRDGTLFLSGERIRPEGARAGRVYEQIEIEYGSFERQIPLREEVDSEATRAEYANGMLTVVLPLVRREPRRITVPVAIERT